MMPTPKHTTEQRFEDASKCGVRKQRRYVGKLNIILLVACFLIGSAQGVSTGGGCVDLFSQHKYLRRSLQTSTGVPTDPSTQSPTASPTTSPTTSPTASPTKAATGNPTTGPTGFPTPCPTTSAPTSAPSPIPTTGMPTAMPVTPNPTPTGTLEPTGFPSPLPTAVPTPTPTVMPVTPDPTPSGTLEPTMAPTTQPTMEPTRATTSDSSLITLLDGESKDMAVIIVAAVGGAAVIFVVIIFIFLYRRRRAKSTPPKHKKEDTLKSVPKKEEPPAKPENRLSLNSSPSKYGGLQAEILLDPEDDISTLGDPTVVTNIRSREALERATERFEVDAPSGKLGMVIATHGSLPVVHAMEPSSVLADRVRIGDVLLSIDGIYCTGKAAVDISRLISKKSNQPTRYMVFARSRDAPNEM